MASNEPGPEFTGVVKWIDRRLPIFTMMYKEYMVFPVPKNLNYFWSFGALASITLMVMLLTGIILAMQYQPNTEMAFNSVERIMRDVNYGLADPLRSHERGVDVLHRRLYPYFPRHVLRIV